MALVVEMHGVVEVAEGGSETLGALGAPVHEEADAQAAEHPEDPHGVALAHPAAVFLRRHIQTLVQPVFDAPAAAVELEPALRRQALRRRAAQQVDRFGLAGADLAVQDGGLRGGGKADRLGGDRPAQEGADFVPALILFP